MKIMKIELKLTIEERVAYVGLYLRIGRIFCKDKFFPRESKKINIICSKNRNLCMEKWNVSCELEPIGPILYIISS